MFTPYIKDEWKENIRSYKYRGSDVSIYYTYVSNPFCNYVVQFIPSWVAPNIITLTGLFLNFIFFTLVNYYGGFDGQGTIPPWACYVSAFCYYFYHMLDIMDGKQARITGSSSPLGLLVDHGCDALTCTILTTSIGSVIKLDDGFYWVLLFLIITITFFFNTWEEYYTGILELPIIHGVSEGCVISCIVMICTGYYGHEIWLQNIMFLGNEYRLNNFIVMSVFIVSQPFNLLSIKKVYYYCRENNKNFSSTLWNLVGMIYIVASLIIVMLHADSEIVRKTPKVLIFVYGLSFAKLVGHLQLAHLADADFEQFRKSIMFSVNILSGLCLAQSFGNLKINLDVVILVLLSGMIIVYLHFAYYVSEELCEFLGINRFTIKPKVEKTQ